MSQYAPRFNEAIAGAIHQVREWGRYVNAGRWQGVATEGKPDLVTREVIFYDFFCPVWRAPAERGVLPDGEPVSLLDTLREEIVPNLPWADEHFAERVGGVPMNPDPSHVNWPWWTSGAEVVKNVSGTATEEVSKDQLAQRKFSHTYSERFWPKRAAGGFRHSAERFHGEIEWQESNHRGIRYEFGDLNDLLDLMEREPMGRQAYLPIFFPEDTGAVHGGRIPCTLGYWFILRNGLLHMKYSIRSCDIVRHFRDDIYMAVRLQLWVLEQLQERELRSDRPQIWVDVLPGYFHMDIGSLHYHMGDAHHVGT